MAGARDSRFPPGGNGSERARRGREGNFDATAGGATFAATAAALLGFVAALAGFGMGRGIGGTLGLKLGAASAKPAGFIVADGWPESGTFFFSLGKISAMLSLRTYAKPYGVCTLNVPPPNAT